MTETLPTEPYAWTMVLDYLASVFAHEVVWKSVVTFLGLSLAVLAVRSIFKVEQV